MSESKPRVTIIGLGLIGTSIGLALQASEAVDQIVGHDKNRAASNQAKSAGAIDKAEWNLIAACDRADLVILATPLDAIEPTLTAIGPELRRGCVVMDTAPVKQQVLAAARALPDGVHFVGGNPILGGPVEGTGTQAARADLLRGSLFCVVPAARTESSAVKLISDLVTILGATPLFLDAAEHDGLVGAVDHLPGLLALALMDMVTGQPTWRELRKMAGPAFEAATRPADGEPEAQAEIYHGNRENLIRWLDSFSAALREVRRMLAEDSAELSEHLTSAQSERKTWLADWQVGTWQEGPGTEMPERPGLLEGFLGGFIRRPDKQQRKEPR
jgi:prephenate dehydrogenase